VTFKEFIKVLNVRDDLLSGKDPRELLRQVPEAQFKLMFWALADLFKAFKREAERRGIWDEMITRRPEPPA
jgi:hypothetical protein